VNCGAGGQCDEYLCPLTGETKSSVCFNSKPAVNFRICPCAECHERNERVEERRKMTRDTPRQSVDVRTVEVKVDRTNVTIDSRLTFVNGSPLGSTLCPTEILSVVGPDGKLTDVLALYDTCSQCTFFDPSLETLCTNTRGSGNESIIIKTFSGQTESSTCRIGELRIQKQDGDPLVIEGLLMGAKKKPSYRATPLPAAIAQMRHTVPRILAREPMDGVSYPTILFGTDLVAKAFPTTVFQGAEGFVDQGFSILKSRLTGRYIPTGAPTGALLNKNVAKVMRVVVEGTKSKRRYDKFCPKYDDVSMDEDEETLPVPARRFSQDGETHPGGAGIPCEDSPAQPNLPDLSDLPDLPDLQVNVIKCFTMKPTGRPQPVSACASGSTNINMTEQPQPISVCRTEVARKMRKRGRNQGRRKELRACCPTVQRKAAEHATATEK
jgi:hypothetical protein